MRGASASASLGPPGVFNVATNFGTSGTTLKTTNTLAGGVHAHILNLSWDNSGAFPVAVTNENGVVGTPICTNNWTGFINDPDVTYAWTNQSMTNAIAVFAVAPTEWGMQTVQLTNVSTTALIDSYKTNFTSSGVTRTNILTSTVNSLVVNFSVEAATATETPTVGSGQTLIAYKGQSGKHWIAADTKAGAVSVTNTVVWTTAPPFDYTSVSVHGP